MISIRANLSLTVLLPNKLTIAGFMANFLAMECSVAKAKDQFSYCLTRAQAGETVIVRKHGKAIAQITGIPMPRENKIQFGSGRGTVKELGDLTEPAFDPGDWDCL